jgi:membrane protease subunit HflK
MQQIFSSTSKIMIDAKSAATINLPLDRMLAQVAANEAAIGSHSGPVMPGQQGPQPMQPWQPPGQVQPQSQQPAPAQQPQPPQQQQPQAQQAQGQQQQDSGLPADSVRLRDPRSRENERERETR